MKTAPIETLGARPPANTNALIRQRSAVGTARLHRFPNHCGRVGEAVRWVLVLSGIVAVGCSHSPPCFLCPVATKLRYPDGVNEGTLLRIVCDLPDEIGRPERMFQARLDWPSHSENFTIRIGPPQAEVLLRSVVPIGAIVRIHFIVDERSPFPTRFEVGEWWYGGLLPREATATHPNARTIPLSKFRFASDEWLKTIAP